MTHSRNLSSHHGPSGRVQTRQHSGRALKGSQFHLQNYVNEYPEYLNCLILSASPSLSAYAKTHPKWVSPIALDNYCEYQDQGFLEAIGLRELAARLAKFWPSGGPVWDALATVEGMNDSRAVILLEGKSHIVELGNPSYACRARGKSLQQIKDSLGIVKHALGAKPEADWVGGYYQYANRLAHLHFLTTAGIPTWLVFLYFVGDKEQNGPSTVAQWTATISEMETTLGLPKPHLLDERIVSVFLPISPPASTIRDC